MLPDTAFITFTALFLIVLFPCHCLSIELLQTSWLARLTELKSSLDLEARLSFHLLTLVALHDTFFLFEDNCQGNPCTQTSPCCPQVLDSLQQNRMIFVDWLFLAVMHHKPYAISNQFSPLFCEINANRTCKHLCLKMR